MKEKIAQFAGVYQEWVPRVTLREHVRCVWVNDLSNSPNQRIAVVPDGCVDIVWIDGNLMVAGPDSHSIHEHVARTTVVGLRFHPGMSLPWFRIPLSEFVNRRVPLSEVWRSDTDLLSNRIAGMSDAAAVANALEECLLNKLRCVTAPDKQIAYLRRAAGDNVERSEASVESIAAGLGMSDRTLRRRCLENFGYGFKTLDRVLRFQRFYRLSTDSAEISLAALATQAGYADQAHLTREAQRLTGRSPGVFLAELRAHAVRNVQDRRKVNLDHRTP